ncbi:hypothetical protein LXL04_025081 [Taraxacum kok-saghyz]
MEMVVGMLIGRDGLRSGGEDDDRSSGDGLRKKMVDYGGGDAVQVDAGSCGSSVVVKRRRRVVRKMMSRSSSPKLVASEAAELVRGWCDPNQGHQSEAGIGRPKHKEAVQMRRRDRDLNSLPARTHYLLQVHGITAVVPFSRTRLFGWWVLCRGGGGERRTMVVAWRGVGWGQIGRGAGYAFIESRSFENSYIPENPRTPKPLTFSKNRLRGAKNRSILSPVAKKNFLKNNFFFQKLCIWRNFFFFFLPICTSLYNTYLKESRSRFFERNNGLGDIGNWGSSRLFSQSRFWANWGYNLHHKPYEFPTYRLETL